MTPRLNSRAVLRHTTGYLAAISLSGALGAVRGFLNARWLGPELYGFWSSLAFFMSFGAHLHFGVREAVTKEIPMCRGQGRNDEARIRTQVAFTFFAAMLLAASAAFWLFAWQLPAQTSALQRIGWWVAGVVLPLEILSVFEQTVTRAEERFQHLRAALVLPTGISLLLTCWLVFSYGLAGFYVVAVLTPALALWCLRRHAEYSWHPRWSWVRLRSMLAVGWPVLAMTLVFESLRWIDRGLILGCIGLQSFGYYGLGLMLMRLCFIVPDVVASVMEPRLHFDYAAHRQAAGVREHVWFPLAALAWVMPFGLALLDLALPAVIQRWLPDYLPGLAAIRILVWSSVFMGLAYSTKSCLVALGEQRRALPIYGLAIAVNLAVSLGLLRRGWGLVGIAVGAAAAQVICSAGLVLFVFRRLGWSWRQTAAKAVSLYAPIAVLCGLTTALPAWVQQGASHGAGRLWTAAPWLGVGAYGVAIGCATYQRIRRVMHDREPVLGAVPRPVLELSA